MEGRVVVVPKTSLAPAVVFVHPDGRREEVFDGTGGSVMQVATTNQIHGIIGECGGELVCATCHVYVDAAWLDLMPAMSAEEREMLEVTSEEPDERSRLSCQLRLDDRLNGLTVHLPASQR